MKSTISRIVNLAQRVLLRLLVAPLRARGLRRIGSAYGGWFVPESMLKQRAVCYSVGVGEDTTFDEVLARDHGCVVVGFDPTPRAVAHGRKVAESTPGFTFHPVGIWSEDVTMRFYEPADRAHVSHSILNIQETSGYFQAECWTLETAMARLGHDAIDLLKLDIEGAEYEVLDSMLRSRVRPATLCVEMHKTSTFWNLLRYVRLLKSSGYRPVSVDDWNVTFVYARAQ